MSKREYTFFGKPGSPNHEFHFSPSMQYILSDHDAMAFAIGYNAAVLDTVHEDQSRVHAAIHGISVTDNATGAIVRNVWLIGEKFSEAMARIDENVKYIGDD